uniref:Uncharacterized protein n=1 Tax=Arundo donax TaxID=35708 RepID=A0A0A8ZQX2_ARUDO
MMSPLWQSYLLVRMLGWLARAVMPLLA